MEPFTALALSSLFSTGYGIYQDRRNEKKQEEFAKHGIRWKVEDAKAAGIHPLAALGAQTTPYQAAFSSVPESFSDLGQDISRAVDKTRTARERTEARLLDLSVERSELENDILRSKIASLKSNGPAFPETNGAVESVPKTVINETPGHPGKEAGTLPSYTHRKGSDGSMYPVPSEDSKEAIEDLLVPSIAWQIENNLLPNFGTTENKPSKKDLPKGAVDWQWSVMKQAWIPLYKGGKKTFIRRLREQSEYIKRHKRSRQHPLSEKYVK